MKKLSFILLMAALALPMMAQRNFATKADAMAAMDRNQVVQTTPVNSDWTNHSTVLNRAQWYEWTFESDADFEGWMSYDADGDGNGWYIDSTNGHEGPTCLASASYSGGVLTPDNWLISPVVNLDGTLTIWAAPYSSYFPDVFAVYVTTGDPEDLNSYVKIGGDYAPTEWTEFTFDLTDYAGAEGCFAIRHYNCTDMWRLLIDDISLGTPVPPMAVPENVTVTPTDVTALVEWEDTENANWTIRFRPYTEPTGYFWDFEEDTDGNTNTELTGGWTTIDADGDGYAWYHLTGSSFVNHSGVGHVTSASYMGGVLYPDDWLVSPLVTLQADLSFWAAGQDPSYAAEVFNVYVSTDMENWMPLGEDVIATSEMTEYTYDLSAYEGQQGYVAIRHYNVSDMFRLNVDDILIGEPTVEEEWTYVDNITETNYTIEGLTPETTYELQVQAYTDDRQESEWTEPVLFTTLPEQAPQGQTASPEVVTTPNDDFYTFTGQVKEGDPEAEVTLFIFDEDGNRVEVTNPFVVDRTEEDQIITIIAVAHIDGQIDGETVITVLVPAKVITGIDEVINGKTVAGVRYYNMAGQEMQEANGMTIVVTTYTDGTTTAVKVMK